MITFEDILGQGSAVDAITTAYRRDRLPHGLIFAGPIGVGKATTAAALGGLFLCEKPKGVSPCGKCESCRVFEAGNHPDYHSVYRQLRRLQSKESVAKEFSIDVIREFLLDRAANKSVIGIGKVFVVEEADLMNRFAQNSLLKMLEEPYDRTLIILLTDQPDALLPTIRSRCQLIRFAPLDEKTVKEQLQKRGIKSQLAASAAKISQGSLGLALRWIEDGVIERAEELAGILEKLSAGQRVQGVQEWFKSAAEAYAEQQLKRDDKASKDQMSREGIVLYLKLSAQFFRQQLEEHIKDPPLLERAAAAIDTIVRAESYIESNVNIPLVLQQLSGALGRTCVPVEEATD
jgi:DNA polymerase-3 subunit delta'